jgi:hypothetical protein
MTQRTRYFLVGSGLIVIVGLCTGLVAYYSGNLPFGSTRGPAELSYVPADTTAIAYADVRHIMDSEFRQRLKALIPTGEGKNELLTETGIDVEKDIDSVVAGLASASAEPRAAHVVLIRGRFQQEKIEALARAHGGTTEDYRGKRLILEPAPDAPADGVAAIGRPGTQEALAFLEPTLVGFGAVESIKRAIDANATRQNVTSNASVMKFVGGATSTDAWVVGRFENVAKDARVAPSMRNQLQSLQWFSISADIDTSIQCRVHAEADTPEAAANVRSVLNGMISAARLMANQDARVNAILNSVQTAGVGQDIDVSFTVPSDLVDVVASAAHAPMGGARPH